MNRRRFLTIAAAAVAAPKGALAKARWRGVALGAEAEITLRGEGGEAGHGAFQSKSRPGYCMGRAMVLIQLKTRFSMERSLAHRAIATPLS